MLGLDSISVKTTLCLYWLDDSQLELRSPFQLWHKEVAMAPKAQSPPHI